IRRGAEVYAVMTDAAQTLIHPYALEYATGHQVICKITGGIEHVEFLGVGGTADLFLIAPSTANTIGKIANGIDDSTVTTFAGTALGSKTPIMIVPAMHESMYDHPIILQNIERLKEIGITFVGPRIEDGIAKIANIDDIVLNVERAFSPRLLSGKKILITSGATKESIDPIRIITNKSSGKTGNELAMEAYKQDADVTLIHSGHLGQEGIREVYVESSSDMVNAVLSELKSGYDALISAAAISDFTLETTDKDKIKSGKPISLDLVPTRKLLVEVKKSYPDVKLIGFKAEVGVSRSALTRRAKSLMRSNDLEFIVANDVGEGGMGTEDNDVLIITQDQVKEVKGPKNMIAKEIIISLCERL
ncbi:MAG: bifunctional phosphopantothenoylcysteine decarboxylase/phosphopantothenate--cysteine ligase CoaBC, partial [Halobacteriota archaeon]|nr:bifunctional phosphopantothenoylcysteine decarboxylase/phosphopantothenate--cysteine ligase CoaBC [Halobacteriota archaeon]